MKKKHFNWILLGAALLWLVVIWGNSSYPREQSAAKSGVVVELLSLFLDKMNVPSEMRQFVVRKAAHFSEFFILGMICSAIFIKKPLPFPIGACLLTALCDEGIQYFVPGRSCELRDVAIDFAGALAGIVLIKIFFSQRSLPPDRKKRKNH